MNLVRNSVRKTDEKHKIEKQKTLKPLRVEGFRGDPSEIRTPDTLIKSQVLCQLS